MNKSMKRLLALVLVLVMSLSLFACGQKRQEDKTDKVTQTETTRVFTDSCGREVTVPADIQRIAVSGPLAQMVVFAIAPDTRAPRPTLTLNIWSCPCWVSCTAARVS